MGMLIVGVNGQIGRQLIRCIADAHTSVASRCATQNRPMR